MSGMADKMKITTITKTKAIIILRHQGLGISSWEVVEGIIRLDRGHQGNLISNSMDTNQTQIGQLRILRQKKSHPNMKMIQSFIMLFRHLWLLSNQIWTSWWTRKITIMRLLQPLQLAWTRPHLLPKMEVFYNILRAKTSHLQSLQLVNSQKLSMLNKSESSWCRIRGNSSKINLPHRSSEPKKYLSKLKKTLLWRIWKRKSFISKMGSNCIN